MSDLTPGASWEQAVWWLRQQADRHQLVLEAYYDDPLEAAASRYWKSSEWSEIRGLLGRDRGLAVDVGAGRGIASFALASDGFRVVAVEPDASALVGALAIRALAKSTSLPIDVLQNTSEQISIADGSADLVFARASLHHTRDLRKTCREFMRILKPGGRVIAVREHVISRSKDLDVFLRRHPLHALYGGENAFLLQEYLDAFTEAGLKVMRVLAPLESAINFAPQTFGSLRGEIATRLDWLPGGSFIVRKILSGDQTMRLILKVLARFDRRPGRLYSFVCVKV